MEIELKRCPFCGGEAKAERNVRLRLRESRYVIADGDTIGFEKPGDDEAHCGQAVLFRVRCKACGVQTREYQFAGEAVRDWNRRNYPFGAHVGMKVYILYPDEVPDEHWELGEEEIMQACDIGFSTEDGGIEKDLELYENVNVRREDNYMIFFDRAAAERMQAEMNAKIAERNSNG